MIEPCPNHMSIPIPIWPSVFLTHNFNSIELDMTVHPPHLSLDKNNTWFKYQMPWTDRLISEIRPWVLTIDEYRHKHKIDAERCFNIEYDECSFLIIEVWHLSSPNECQGLSATLLTSQTWLYLTISYITVLKSVELVQF